VRAAFADPVAPAELGERQALLLVCPDDLVMQYGGGAIGDAPHLAGKPPGGISPVIGWRHGAHAVESVTPGFPGGIDLAAGVVSHSPSVQALIVHVIDGKRPPSIR
jgi:hypothetical protein